MTGKECLELAILEYEKETIYDENNQWVKNVLKGLKQIKQDLDRLEKIKGIFEDMKDARDNASFQQDDEVFLTIFTELSHWCEQLEEVLEDN